MGNGLTVLLTIHGIGFQRPPVNDAAGYADGLHEHLRQGLGELLNDDPNRARGPVYVSSSWPPGSDNEEAGLARLGTWKPGIAGIDYTKAPLGADKGVFHLAFFFFQAGEKFQLLPHRPHHRAQRHAHGSRLARRGLERHRHIIFSLVV